MRGLRETRWLKLIPLLPLLAAFKSSYLSQVSAPLRRIGSV